MPKYAKQTPDGIVVVAEFAADPGGGYVAVAAAGVRPSPIHTLSLSNGVLQWVDARALADVKVTAWGAIKAERERRLAGTFTHAGNTYDIDPVNIAGASIDAREAVLAGEALPLGIGWSQMWVLPNNTTVTLTANQMISVGRACKTAVSNLWATSQYLRGQIDAATTIPQVEAITWP